MGNQEVKVPSIAEARAAHEKNAARFSKAVQAEVVASRAAESGEQMARLAAFRALAELDVAEAANAKTAAVVEQAVKNASK